MEIDINIESHDLLWRRMSHTVKKRYTDSFGVKRAEAVETEMAKLIESLFFYIKFALQAQ